MACNRPRASIPESPGPPGMYQICVRPAGPVRSPMMRPYGNADRARVGCVVVQRESHAGALRAVMRAVAAAGAPGNRRRFLGLGRGAGDEHGQSNETDSTSGGSVLRWSRELLHCRSEACDRLAQLVVGQIGSRPKTKNIVTIVVGHAALVQSLAQPPRRAGCAGRENRRVRRAVFRGRARLAAGSRSRLSNSLTSRPT